MEAVKDEAYMNWWRYNGEMANCDVEYPAWKAGRAYQHQFEKSAQHGLHQTACAECGQALYHKQDCPAINHPLAIAAGKA